MRAGLVVALLIAIASTHVAATEVHTLDSSASQSQMTFFGTATSTGTSLCAFDAGERLLGEASNNYDNRRRKTPTAAPTDSSGSSPTAAPTDSSITGPMSFANNLVSSAVLGSSRPAWMMSDGKSGSYCVHSLRGAIALGDLDTTPKANLQSSVDKMHEVLCADADAAQFPCCSETAEANKCALSTCIDGFGTKKVKEEMNVDMQVPSSSATEGYQKIDIQKLQLETKKAVVCISSAGANPKLHCKTEKECGDLSVTGESSTISDDEKQRYIATRCASV